MRRLGVATAFLAGMLGCGRPALQGHYVGQGYFSQSCPGKAPEGVDLPLKWALQELETGVVTVALGPPCDDLTFTPTSTGGYALERHACAQSKGQTVTWESGSLKRQAQDANFLEMKLSGVESPSTCALELDVTLSPEH